MHLPKALHLFGPHGHLRGLAPNLRAYYSESLHLVHVPSGFVESYLEFPLQDGD